MGAQLVSHAVERQNTAIVRLVCALGDPHAVEGLELGDGRAADPAGELTVRRRHQRHLVVILGHQVLDALV